MSLPVKKVTHNDKDYAVIDIKYKNKHLPLVIDWDDYGTVSDLEKTWKCHKNGFISCNHHHKGSLKEVFLHDIIMYLKNPKKSKDASILHINRVGLDNRKKNVEYQGLSNFRNTKKKKRTIKFPKKIGIDPNEIPTYVWYLKPNGSHGERFSVEIGDIKWKTTASKNVTINQKLDDAKDFLKQLKVSRADLFEDHSMNGDFTQDGQHLLNEYQSIVQAAGYDNIILDTDHSNTDRILNS